MEEVNPHIQDIIDFDIRRDMFQRAVRFVDYEMVEGDIVEFGVYTGRSLALLSYYHQQFKNSIHGEKTPTRKTIGLDWYQGLPENDHGRWTQGVFSVNHSWHPTIPKGVKLTPMHVSDFFEACGLDTPTLVNGKYNDPAVVSNFRTICNKVSLVHIDCDIYESTRDALNMIKHGIQNGCIILFDDWFNFKGSSDVGEQRAFNEFLKDNPHIEAIPYQPYATFCQSFILRLSTD